MKHVKKYNTHLNEQANNTSSMAKSQQELDNFIKDSKVKETVYHGSPIGGLEELTMGKSSVISSGLKESAIYLTSNKALAGLYKDKRKLSKEFKNSIEFQISKLDDHLSKVRSNREFDAIESQIKKLRSKMLGEIYELKLNIKNPLIFDAKGEDGMGAWDNFEIDLGYKVARGREAVNMIAEKNPVAKKYFDCDGIIAKNIIDLHGSPDSKYLGDVYVVFNSNQILIKPKEGI